jgi:hypothetical protein
LPLYLPPFAGRKGRRNWDPWFIAYHFVLRFDRDTGSSNEK